MTPPDSNADSPSSKYNVQIGQAQGPVIGDNVHVVQHFHGTLSKPQVDLAAAEVIYRQQVVETYKWLDFGGFARPDLSLANVPLEEVFVRLTLTVETTIQVPVPTKKVGQAERRESGHRKKTVTVQEPIELDKALSKHLLIVGEPGAGKSTLLRWLAVTFAQGRQREPNRVGLYAEADRLPVLVELGHLPDRYLKPEGGETPNWIYFLPEYITGLMAFNNTPPQLLTQALADGRCLLLFDGLDEVADRQARTRLARSLAELTTLSAGSRVIIGSRPAGLSESEGTLRPHFQRCQIERFTPDDFQRFFHFWYALDRELTPKQQREGADALYTRVQANPATQELAATPLLSTILVLIWRNEGDLPQRRVELYERCCRVLIEHWEASHDVAYQGVLIGMDWEDHLRLLTPLAYVIHSQKERTSATRAELIPVLAQALQGWYAEQDTAIRGAKKFLDTLSIRSGLLQYMGDDRYGFPHQTFQEYLAARYIAAQSDPEYIDLVMAHLHETWWQQIHLLTIAHLGSGSTGASKASALVLTILHMYRPPSWILRSSRNRWLRLIEPGKLLPQVQLERRIAWILAREFELAIKGYLECVLDGTTAMLDTVLSTQAASLVRNIIYDRDRRVEQRDLLTVTYRLLQRQGHEARVTALQEVRAGEEGGVSRWQKESARVRWRAADSLGHVGANNEAEVRALLEALHNGTWDARWRAAVSLGHVGAGDEAVVRALQEALHDAAPYVRECAVASLVQIGAGNKVVLRAVQEALHDADHEVRRRAAEILGQVGAGNEAAVSALLEALHYDADHEVRRRAALSLRKVGADNEAAVSALLEALHDTNWEVRLRAAESLGQVGTGNEAVANALLETLHVGDWLMRRCAVESLGQVGVGNEAVVSALLEALHDADHEVRLRAAESLGRLEIEDTIQLRRVLLAFNCYLCYVDRHMPLRRAALRSLSQLLDGRPIPGYRWIPLAKRRAQRRRLKRIAFCLGMLAVMLVIGLAATSLLGVLAPTGFPMRFLAGLAGIVAFVAAITQVTGWRLRDPWDHS